jgi:ketosteroid isomerase-like protein
MAIRAQPASRLLPAANGTLTSGLLAHGDIDVVKAVYAAFDERDVEGVVARSHADIVFAAVTGDEVGRGEPYRGHDGIRQYFRDLATVWDELRIVPGEYRQTDDTVLVTGRVSARSPARIVAGSTGWIWRLREGLVVYARVYPSAADAMAAFEGRGA